MFKLMLSFSLLASFATSAFSAPQTFPMKCRSGANSAMVLSAAGELRFSFAKAPMAAGANGENLRPGQCAFVDRAIGAGEPSDFTTAITSNFKVGAYVPNKLNTAQRGYFFAASQAWVYNFSTADTILTINVYNDGQYMRAPNP